MRSGSPSNYDGLSLSELKTTVHAMKENELNLKKQEINLEQHISLVAEQLRILKHWDSGSSSTVSSAGEGGNKKPPSQAPA